MKSKQLTNTGSLKPRFSATQTKRLSVSFTNDLVEVLENLSTTQGVSQNEILRRALATESYIQGEIANGSTVLIQKKNGDIREVVFR